MFNDLQPYVCTYPSCGLFDHLFENQDAWYQHETLKHRIEWFCNSDGHPHFAEQSDFFLHMRQDHDTTLDMTRSPNLLDVFVRPSSARGGICNLCCSSTTNLRLHVSRHLEQVALFALPRSDYSADDESIQDNSDGTDSNVSRNKVKGSVNQEKEPLSRSSSTEHAPSESRRHPSQPSEPQNPDLTGKDDIDQVGVPDAEYISWDDVIKNSQKPGEAHRKDYHYRREW